MNLIICIDDVDMSRQYHMHIMQCIHQYFMIPHVIVMVTLNFPILAASLQKDTFLRLETCKKKDKQNLHLAFEHTHDFLRKVIPSDMRITMPSWRKYDYRTLTPPCIDLGNSKKVGELKQSFSTLKDSVLFKKLEEHVEENYKLNPKEVVMMMLADRTKIYLDVRENKIHFMEPDSLRNLYDIFYMLYHMKDIASLENCEEKREVYLRDRKANRKILLDYFYFKLLPEYDFSTEEEKIINEFIAEPIERRGKRIWDYYFKRLTSKEEAERIVSIYGEAYYSEEKNRYKIENYSFGDLFRVLYSASRIDLIDRKLIKFILASLSFSLPQFVEDEKWRNSKQNKDSNNKKNNYRNLRDVFGYTFLGTWREDLFSGYQIDTVIYEDVITKLCKNNKKKRSKKVDIINDNFKKFIEDLMLLLLMTSRTTRDDFLVIRNKSGFFSIENDIDPTAFIMNSLRMDERLEKMKFKYDESYESDFEDGKVKCYSISKLLSAIFKKIGYTISNEDFNMLVKERLEKWQKSDSDFYDEKMVAIKLSGIFLSILILHIM